MRNIAIINNGDSGSTGNIAMNLHHDLIKAGYNSVFCYGRGKAGNNYDTYRIDNAAEYRWHALLTRITGKQGFYSQKATSRLLTLFKNRNIDTIFIVCIHGYYINERRLYQYIAECNIRLIHIMIDEYAYTGKCAYHDGCERFLTGCGRCPHKKDYPSNLFLDGSKVVFESKLSAYKKLNNAVFVGPQFVVEQAQKSPLFQNIKTEILDESIDTEIFRPKNVENIRKQLGIKSSKIVILTVVPYYGEKRDRKGGRYFIELAHLFEKDDRFVFVHVGYLNKKKEHLPNNFIPIGYISDLSLLAEYFSLGDIFVFPSLLDTMPNACLDALACGTPLLCFNVSGMPYIANDEVATFVEPQNIDAMAEIIVSAHKKTPSIIEKCRNYALQRYDCRKYNEKLIKIANK